MAPVTVAAVQTVSGPDVADNLAAVAARLDEAAAAGARLAVLPENFALMGRDERDKLAHAEADGDGPIQAFLAAQAKRHALWLVGDADIGVSVASAALPIATGDPGRVRAACPVYDDRGRRVARYDKIHLFDVELPGGERYAESETIVPGERPVVVATPFGRLGLAVCYDLRFPELFRRLVDGGMELLALPAAFTDTTGRAHWEVLLRARAVENLCHVVAAAQGGHHADGRETWGDSLVIDPWGRVLARRAKGAGVVTATLDPALTAQHRRTFPALAHRRLGGG